MELLLLVAKYGVIIAGFLVVASSASKDLSLLFARIRKQSKFVQLCVFAFIMTAVVYGGSKPSTNSVSTSTEPLNSFNSNVSLTHSATTSTHTLPQWYIEHGYPSTDTDGDGIPDAWERWTHTKPLSNDALVDYNGDGVDNITEFMYMCDPIRKDTDGDGLDDNIEIDCLTAGIEGLNPVVRATFDIPEPDLDGDGIADLWDEVAYYNSYNLFSDDDGNGFDDVYANNMPAASQNNFDVAVTISTSRTALLTWDNDAMLISPCTNKSVKLRLNADIDVESIDLTVHPDTVQFSGLWKAKMSVQFDVRHNQQAEQNRIKLSNGCYIDFDEMSSQYVGYISSAQQYGRNKPSKMPSIKYKLKKLILSVDSSGVCVEHGPNPRVWLNTTTNTLPLYAFIGEETVLIEDNDIDIISYFSPAALSNNPIIVSVYKEEQYGGLNIAESITIHKSKICRPAQTNIVGACWTSSHDPNDDSDHLPGYEEVEVQFGPNCPTVTDVNAKIGFSHDYVNTRNLPIIENSSELDKTTDHCIAKIWKPNQTINLNNFIDLQLQTLQSEYFFVVSGVQLNGSSFATPDKYLQDKESYIYHIELRDKKTRVVLDRLWVVVIGRLTWSRFENWIYLETQKAPWIYRLPKPKAKLDFNREDLDPEPEVDDLPNYWKEPKILSSWLHHDSQYEMRSYKTIGSHGNQSCYDNFGNIVLEGIAGGTADYAYAVWWNVFEHVKEDVDPFIWAILLDGNPCSVNLMNEISRPCLYQGSYLKEYLKYRPIIKPE